MDASNSITRCIVADKKTTKKEKRYTAPETFEQIMDTEQSEQPNKKHKAHQESTKAIWLLTYASGSPDITHEMLYAHGITCMECYTITWRESKYTLIYLDKPHRVRNTALEKVMRKLEDYHEVKGSYITGYEMIESNHKKSQTIEEHPGFQRMVQILNKNYIGHPGSQSIANHPGFQRMVQMANENISELSIWMESGDIFTNRKGLLWKYLDCTPVKLMTRAQLEERVLRQEKTTASRVKAFSAHSTLLRYRHEKPVRETMKRISIIEKTLNRVLQSSDGSGEIYAAWNPLMTNLYKLGFTYRDAKTRVRELQTAGVLEPFELVRHVHVPDARLYEKAMHIFFQDVRVYKRKEFFAVSDDDINAFFDIVQGTQASEQWALALKLAAGV